MKVVTQDPDEKLDYEWDFTSDLVEGDGIQSVTVTAEPDTMTTITDVDHLDGRVVAWAEGGRLGTTVELKCTITTTAGRRFVRRTSLLMRHR